MICPLVSYSTPWIADLSTPDVRSYKEQFDSLPQSNSALTIYVVYNKTRRFSYLACVSCHTDVVSKCHPLSGGGHVYTVVCHMTGVDGASRPLPLPLPAVSTVSRAEHSGWLTGSVLPVTSAVTPGRCHQDTNTIGLSTYSSTWWNVQGAWFNAVSILQ